jgi:hypothetical protein
VIELIGETLRASFPEVHENACCKVTFQRTLRIPDDGKTYPLPAGLGKFPLYSVDDYNVPAAWKEHGGVFMPMYQSEAMWMNFDAVSEYPFALKIAAGKVNAVTGSLWTNELGGAPQEFVVLPEQRWIDGFYVAKGVVRQFVAASLGSGVTVEEQITGKAEFGGIQLLFVPMKRDFYRANIEVPKAITAEMKALESSIRQAFRDLEPLIERAEERMARLSVRLSETKEPLGSASYTSHWYAARTAAREANVLLEKAEALLKMWEESFAPMRRGCFSWAPDRTLGDVDELEMLCASLDDIGLGAGGRIRQEIAADPWGVAAWDLAHASRCYVHLVNSISFKELTGKLPPTSPISADEYNEYGIPWFDYYIKGDAIAGSDALANVKSVAEMSEEWGERQLVATPICISGTIDLSITPKRNPRRTAATGL